MILNLPEIKYEPVSRLFPSSYTALKGCHYKFILSKALGSKSILPISIHSYKGTFAHKILEHISRGNIFDEESFSIFIERELAVIDEQILRDGNHNYYPLRKNLKNFGLLKISLRKFLKDRNDQKVPVNTGKFFSEMWCESKDKRVGGKIDLSAEYPAYIEIADFKTGAITEELMDDEGEKYEEIKVDYQEQLQLYGALFFEHTDKKPDALFLIDLHKNKFEVNFSMDESLKLLSKAKQMLDNINEEISSKEFVALPSVENCKFCLNRPACQHYQSALLNGLVTNDITGKISKVQKFLNGNVSLFLETQIGNVIIKNFDTSFFDSFQNAISKKVTVYNVRSDRMDNSFLSSNMTRIYEQ